jgi:hypothetical protein
LLLILTTGAFVSSVIEMEVCDVQPLGKVTTTEYVPGALIIISGLLLSPLFQLYVPPPEAVRLIVGVVQVKILVPVLLVIDAVAVFTVNTSVAILSQPLEFIKLTVYEPAAL